MDLSSLLDEKCIQIGSSATSKAEVIAEVAELAMKSPALSGVSKDILVKGLNEREELGTTGFGDGIAIPHCVVDDAESFVVGMLVVPDGVDFDSLDEEKTKLLTFIIGPSSERKKHISILAMVSRTLRVPGLVEEILAENSPLAVRESVLRFSSNGVTEDVDKEYCLFHVFVQSEEYFSDILESMTINETTSLSITDGADASTYLYKVPLFASFMVEEHKGFTRMITAVVGKSHANDTIRQISDIVGGLEKCDTVMVAVQDLFFTAGSLRS